MKVTLWGTRGSVPTPGPETIRYGGNTSCVEVEGDDGTLLVLDAGTGIRRLSADLPSPFTATRYHSLVIRPETLSDEFETAAWASAPDGSREIMAIRHTQYPVHGLQFHPESFLTDCGHELLARFLALG